MKFTTIQADGQGETHFGVRDIPDREVPFGPPPNRTGRMTDFGAVTTMFVFSVPAGTNVPAHNAPQPYICISLSGEGEIVTSDGEARRFRPGDVLFCDDLTGKGHVTRAITDVVAAFVNRTTAQGS
jgi:quercetin dioxygenase-like cupin family protein